MKCITACLVSAVMFAAAASSAIARDDEAAYLPEAVAEAWGRYLAAREAGDSQAAGDAAMEAHRAAESEGVDTETRAILADTAGQFAFIRGQFPEARAVLGLAASLYGEMGESQTNSQVRMLALIAVTHFNEENSRGTLSGVDQVLAAAGPPGANPDRDKDIVSALMLRARTHWRDGSLSQAGSASLEALDVMEPYSIENFTSSGLMAFYAGVESALRRRHSASAWWLAVADHLFREQDQGGHLMTVTDIWSRYARSRLTAGERRELISRLADAGFISAPAQEAAETELAEAEQEEVREAAAPDPNNRPARPINRRAPDYPPQAAAAGVDGVALVTFTVGANGRVRDAEVVFSAPHPVFGESALRAVRTWRYEPRLVDGVPTDHEGVQTTLDFRMAD